MQPVFFRQASLRNLKLLKIWLSMSLRCALPYHWIRRHPSIRRKCNNPIYLPDGHPTSLITNPYLPQAPHLSQRRGVEAYMLTLVPGMSTYNILLAPVVFSRVLSPSNQKFHTYSRTF
jgi:hypothetical protein